jgi:hypothetical protein
MAARSHASFKKRQKELARIEKQRDKAARRMQRKQEERQTRGPEVAELEPPDGSPEAPSSASGGG